MAYTTRIQWETLRTVNSASVMASYVALGTPLLNASYKLKMVNRSAIDVFVSIDGVNPIDICPSNSFWLYDEDITVNHEGIPAGTQILVKSVTGSGGVDGTNIYLVSQYILVN